MASLAEIVRGEGARYLSTHAVTANQYQALLAIAGCRTEALGSVLETCEQCEVEYVLFRSCRNRSCPQCQGQARANWLAARTEDILPVPYLHAVFKAPRELHKLAMSCPKQVYDILIRCAGQAVIDVGWSELHAQLGCQTQFQTWTQDLARHLHTHCVIPCGGFSEDGSRWISFEPEQLPARALSRRFRTLVCRAIREAARAGKFDRLPDTVSVEQIMARAMDREWKVYAKPPFGGPEQLLAYLAQYTNRVAITNDRIERYEDHQVTFRWRDYGDGCRVRPRTLDGQAFSSTLRDACAAERIRSNPLVWFSGEPEPQIESRTGSPVHWPNRHAPCASAGAFPALSALPGVLCHQTRQSHSPMAAASAARTDSASQPSSATDPVCCRMTPPTLCIAAPPISNNQCRGGRKCVRHSPGRQSQEATIPTATGAKNTLPIIEMRRRPTCHCSCRGPASARHPLHLGLRQRRGVTPVADRGSLSSGIRGNRRAAAASARGTGRAAE